MRWHGLATMHVTLGTPDLQELWPKTKIKFAGRLPRMVLEDYVCARTCTQDIKSPRNPRTNDILRKAAHCQIDVFALRGLA